MGSASRDPHKVCISCRGSICSADQRCDECVSWPAEMVDKSASYQLLLQRKRESRLRRKGRASLSLPQEAPVPIDALDEESGSLGPYDSVSQVQEPSPRSAQASAPPLALLSTVFGASFKEYVSDLVMEQLQCQLAGNLTSLPARSLPSAQGMAEAIASPLSHLDAVAGAQALPVDESEEGSRRRELSGYRDSIGQTLSRSDTLPPTGKRHHPPKDVPWRIKRSRTEVEGRLVAPNPSLPAVRTRDEAIRETPLSHALLSAQGEGLTVASALGARVTKVAHPTQSRGRATQLTRTSPMSTKAQDGHTSSKDAHHYHHLDNSGDATVASALGIRVAEATQPTQLRDSSRLARCAFSVSTGHIGQAQLHREHSLPTQSREGTEPQERTARAECPSPPDPSSAQVGRAPGREVATSLHRVLSASRNSAGVSVARDGFPPPAPPPYPMGEGSEGDSSEEERTKVEPPHTDFKKMMEFIVTLFPEAEGTRPPPSRPLPPGEPEQLETRATPGFTRAQPMQFSLDSASTSLLKATESSRPTLARYPTRKVMRPYRVSGHEAAGRAARVNPDLALSLTIRSGEPQAYVQQSDMVRLEDSLASLREAQNFTFWCLGAFFRLFQSTHASLEAKAMGDQLFRSMQRALVHQAQESAVELANVKALRRESYLRYLPASFTTATKVDLRKSSLDSGLLFDQDLVKAALDRAEKTASLTFQQAAAKALAKPRPAPGTPLVERGHRPPTAPASVRQSRTGEARRPSASYRRDHGSQQSRPRTLDAPSTSTSRGKGRFFRR